MNEAEPHVVCVCTKLCLTHGKSARTYVCFARGPLVYIWASSPLCKSESTLKAQWLKKVSDLEELVDVVEFKVTNGETELTKLCDDLKSNLTLLTTKVPNAAEGGTASFKTRLNSFMAEMQSWLMSVSKKEDAFVFVSHIVADSSNGEPAIVLHALNFFVRHKASLCLTVGSVVR